MHLMAVTGEDGGKSESKAGVLWVLGCVAVKVCCCSSEAWWQPGPGIVLLHCLLLGG